MPTVTFNVPPGFDYTVTPRRRAEKDSPENGSVRARKVNARSQSVYGLSFNEEPAQVVRWIERLFDDTYGGVDTMNYTPLGAVTPIEVRFAEGTLKTVYTSAAAGRVNLELEQVL